jgi:hypothetical protein
MRHRDAAGHVDGTLSRRSPGPPCEPGPEFVVANLAVLIVSRSSVQPFWRSLRRWNPALYVLGGSAVLVLAFVLSIPALRAFFGFELPHGSDLVRALIWTCAPVFFLELLKVHRRSPAVVP